MLGVRFSRVVLVEMAEFSIFRCFGAKLAIVDRVSIDVVTLEGLCGFETVADVVVDEKTVIFCKISPEVALVVPNFVFLPFPGIARDCDDERRLHKSWDCFIGVEGVVDNRICRIELISGGFGAGEGAGGENDCLRSF
jgi:hypothetical protein